MVVVFPTKEKQGVRMDREPYQHINVAMSQTRVNANSTKLRNILERKFLNQVDDPGDEIVWDSRVSTIREENVGHDKIIYLDALLHYENGQTALEILKWSFVDLTLALLCWGHWVKDKKILWAMNPQNKARALVLGRWLGATTEYFDALKKHEVDDGPPPARPDAEILQPSASQSKSLSPRKGPSRQPVPSRNPNCTNDKQEQLALDEGMIATGDDLADSSRTFIRPSKVKQIEDVSIGEDADAAEDQNTPQNADMAENANSADDVMIVDLADWAKAKVFNGAID